MTWDFFVLSIRFPTAYPELSGATRQRNVGHFFDKMLYLKAFSCENYVGLVWITNKNGRKTVKIGFFLCKSHMNN